MESNIKKIKVDAFFDFNFIDYDYNVEDFFIDVNNFKIEQTKPSEMTKPKEKDKKGIKDKKKDKSKAGTNLSKQISGLSALSNKKKFVNNTTNNAKVMAQINNNKKIQTQLKNVQKGYKSAGKKIENQIKQIIASTKKTEKEEVIIKEEIIFTGDKTDKQEKDDDFMDEVGKNPNPKKQKKIKKPNNPVLVETKAPTIESKQIDDFISQLKSQKTQKETEIAKKIDVISIRNFIKQFRNTVSEDATKKLKVKGKIVNNR